MKTRSGSALVSSLLLLVVSGCSSNPPAAPTGVPEALRVPGNQALAVVASATGVQIYQCMARKDNPDAFEWAFSAPEALLTDGAGRTIGKHYGGPTWEALDGGKVVGEVKARDAGPDPSAIPWLLLGAKSNAGSGVFSSVVSVQRLQTVGGNAPTSACGRANLQQLVRVAYTANYYFYVAKP
jgi:hypothetical protein